MMENEKQLFAKSDPQVWESYHLLAEALKTLGPFTVEVKKTSLHLVTKSAFVGIHPKKKWLDLNIVLDYPLQSDRVRKTEQVSKSRYHNEIRLTQLGDVNTELITWLHQAYLLKI